MSDAVLYEMYGQTAVITLNRPEKRNVVNLAMRDGVLAAWRRFDADPSARVAILTAAGDKAFCAGRDLSEAASGHGHGFIRCLLCPGHVVVHLARPHQAVERLGELPLVHIFDAAQGFYLEIGGTLRALIVAAALTGIGQGVLSLGQVRGIGANTLFNGHCLFRDRARQFRMIHEHQQVCLGVQCHCIDAGILALRPFGDLQRALHDRHGVVADDAGQGFVVGKIDERRSYLLGVARMRCFGFAQHGAPFFQGVRRGFRSGIRCGWLGIFASGIGGRSTGGRRRIGCCALWIGQSARLLCGASRAQRCQKDEAPRFDHGE